MKTKVNEGCEATRLRRSGDACRIGSRSGYLKLSKQLICYLTKPAAMAWLPRHVSIVKVAKPRQKQAGTFLLKFKAGRQLNQ